VADSKKVKAAVIENLGVSPEKVCAVPIGGVDLDDFQYFHRERKREALTVGCVGNFHRAKGHAVLLEAARGVLEKHPKVKFALVGGGKRKGQLMEIARGFGVAGSVEFLGYRHDIAEVLGERDVYVQPSLSEGLCMAVIEAMATGLPVVGTNVGGIPESVVESVNGFLVPPGDPGRLEEKILQLVEDPLLREQMGREGRRIVEEKYGFRMMIEDFEKVIDEVIREKMGCVYDGKRKRWVGEKDRGDAPV